MKRAKEAARQLAAMDQQRLDTLCHGIHQAALQNAARLGKLAWEETGFGSPEDKEKKNRFAAQRVYEAIRGETYIGLLGEDKDKKIVEIGVPLGIIAGLVPSTNPTSTVIYKAMIALKAGNPIIFSPHPSAVQCIGEATRVVAQGVEEAGGPKDAVQCLHHPTMEGTQALLRHRDLKLTLATGGAAMVRMAYSAGHPAIGVGAGNGPAYLHPSCDVRKAVARIFASKTFDNGTICASEQSIVVSRDMAPQVEEELRRQGGYLLPPEEKEKLGRFLLRPNGTMNPAIVGKTAQVLCQKAGLKEPPPGTRVLLAREDRVGEGVPFSSEKLAPVLAYYVEENENACLARCVEILQFEGAGHSFMIHGEDREAVLRFGAAVPASRVLVNTPGALGGIGDTTNLFPALTLGCGAAGGSSSSDNIGPQHLSERRRIAWGVREAEGPAPSAAEPSQPTTAQIARLVEEIMGRLS
jgi:acetaldehyde dehydrogenase (acetylating)